MIKYALIGNQNSGKTTLFNTLTGAHAQVGNWPGVTVEKKEGVYTYPNEESGAKDLKAIIVDLPGIYSLSPYSPEEIVSRNFLIDEHPDVCINIVDATNLERNLYLTTQVLEIDVPVVIALNMIDAAYKKGIEIDTDKLSSLLGVPVIAISALKGTNVDDLMLMAYKQSLNRRKGSSIIEKDASLAKIYAKSLKLLEEKDPDLESKPYHAVKLLENDEEEVKYHPDLEAEIKKYRDEEPLDVFEGDYQGKVADARFKFITDNIDNFVTRKLDEKKLKALEYEETVRSERVNYQNLKNNKKLTLKDYKSKIKAVKKDSSLSASEKESKIAAINKEKEAFIASIDPQIKEKKEYIDKNTTKSEKIDRVLTSKIWGIPLFIIIMFLVFHLTFGDDFLYIGSIIKAATGSELGYGEMVLGMVENEACAAWLSVIFGIGLNCPGTMLANIVECITGDVCGITYGLSLAMENLPSNWLWLESLILDGVWGGLAMVLSFIPPILVLFFFISILEDSGYMARAAFIMDRAFRGLGLSGKAFMPLIMCFGCGVPGIYATKSLETERERKVTVMLTPFFSCGAKLEIWLAFAAVLWGGSYGSLIIFGIYMIGIVVAFLTALILKLTRYQPKASPFLMELPDYHLPQMKSVGVRLWEKLKHYIYKAATIITVSIIVIWLLQHLTFDLQYIPDLEEGEVATLTVKDSMLGVLSEYLRYIFIPTGFGDYSVYLLNGEIVESTVAGATQVQLGGYLVVAVFAGLIAKENVPASLASVSVAAGFASSDGIIQALALNPVVSFSYMAFNLLTIPCMAAVSAARSELSETKDFVFTLILWILVGYIVAVFINIWQVGLIVLGMYLIIKGGKALITYLRNKKSYDNLDDNSNKPEPPKESCCC